MYVLKVLFLPVLDHGLLVQPRKHREAFLRIHKDDSRDEDNDDDTKNTGYWGGKEFVKMMKTMIMKTVMMRRRIPGCAVVDCEGGELARSGAANHHCYYHFDNFDYFDEYNFEGYYHYHSLSGVGNYHDLEERD